MHFSRISIKSEMIRHNRQLLSKLVGGGNYFHHALLWNLFPEDKKAKRDFLYRCDLTATGLPVFYVISKREPLKTAPEFLVESKNFAPKIAADDRFRFTLRANATVARKNGEKAKRHDVIMDEKKRLKQLGEEININEIMQTAGIKWLADRCENLGFRINPNEVSVDAYERHKFQKNQQSIPICFSSIDFAGTLTVLDPAVFQTTLVTGMGREKSFGCGMLLIRRV